jgi:catechol 2,3-dioxygenase-like lactoylglutathione lyase family enzyme
MISSRDRATASMEESSRSDASILQIDHVNLVVRDMAAMIAFYRDVLDMTLARQVTIDGEWIDDVTGLSGVRADVAFLEAANGPKIELLYYHAPRALPIDGLGAANVPGLRHFAFRVSDIDRLAERLRAAGVPLLSKVHSVPTAQVAFAGAQKRLVYFQDPEGNLLELCEYA